MVFISFLTLHDRTRADVKFMSYSKIPTKFNVDICIKQYRVFHCSMIFGFRIKCRQKVGKLAILDIVLRKMSEIHYVRKQKFFLVIWRHYAISLLCKMCLQDVLIINSVLWLLKYLPFLFSYGFVSMWYKIFVSQKTKKILCHLFYKYIGRKRPM